MELKIYKMVKQFISDCLFFQGEQEIHKYLGLLSWISVAYFIFHLIKYINN